jgi:retinol dehydrogenase 12
MPVTLITGANSGMGFETALALGALGHEILVCTRSLKKGENALSKMREQNVNIKGKVFALDLASFKSVSECATNIKSAYSVVDILLFNAGVMTPPYKKTADGFESQFQSNYLGHFYLFNLLQEPFFASPIKKVISISSLSSEKGVNDSVAKFEADARCAESDYEAMKCYRESKLAQVLFTRELHYRFNEKDAKSYAVHPGVVNTNLFYQNSGGLYAAIMQPFAWLGYWTGFLKTPRQGAETAIYLASNEVEESGLYWADKHHRQHNPIADNRDFCREFWNWSESILPDKS